MINTAAGERQTANIDALQSKAEQQSFIGIRRVVEIAGLSKSSIDRKIKARAFPPPVIAEGNLVRWDLGEVLVWREQQFKKREQRLAQTQAEQVAP